MAPEFQACALAKRPAIAGLFHARTLQNAAAIRVRNRSEIRALRSMC